MESGYWVADIIFLSHVSAVSVGNEPSKIRPSVLPVLSPMRHNDTLHLVGCIFWTIVGTDSDASWAVILIDRGH